MNPITRILWAICMFSHQLRHAKWIWHTPRYTSATCSAWPLWVIAIHLPPWGLGVVHESWGLRLLLVRWHLVAHFPERALTTSALRKHWPFNRRTGQRREVSWCFPDTFFRSCGPHLNRSGSDRRASHQSTQEKPA